ncbi:MAG: BREX-1 system phosphatase PglZ type A [Saprospiraceae bacterium]
MNKIEESLFNIFQDHRVVFWYDDQGKMLDQFDEVSMDGVEKIAVDNNEFAIKYKILRGQPAEKFLLYFANGEKPMSENWLLDLQLAYKEFYTDQEAMFLQEIGLDYHFKELVVAHSEFFQSKERRNKLKELIGERDTEKELQFKMMAIVFNTNYANLETYIHAFASQYIEGNDKIEKELLRFHLQEPFWKMVQRKFNYQSDEVSIYDFMMDVFSRNFTLTRNGRTIKETGILLSLWKDTMSYQESFKKVSDKAAGDLKVTALLQNALLDTIIDDDIFQDIDKKIIHELAGRLINKEIRVQALSEFIKKRENKYWYNTYIDFYACLEHAGQMSEKIMLAEGQKIESIEQAASQYAESWHQIDYHYRKFVFHYRQSGQNSVLGPLKEKVLKEYSNKWLLQVNNNLQDKVNHVDEWIYRSQKAQVQFFKNHVKSFTARSQRLFVIITDALRYENGWELCQQLHAEKRFEADIEYMISPLPSYTQLGMAALLPHTQLEIKGQDGSVIADGQSTLGIQGRTKVLEMNSGVRAVAVKAEDFMLKNAATEGRQWVKEYDLIYIYHNRIDKTGDDTATEEKVFDAVEAEIVFIRELLRRIANVNGSHIYITSDHGYLYQHEVVGDNDFAVSDVKGEVWKENRRFILGKNLEASNAMKHYTSAQLGLAGDTEVMITKSTNRLRVKGAGFRFVHGGASLQEIVVPLIKVAWKREDTIKQTDIDIIQSTDKITTNILAISFLQKELVNEKVQPRQLRTYLKSSDETVLSDYFTYLFNATEGSERQREVKHRFQLSSAASSKYRNQQVTMVLEEPVEGTAQWKVYKTYMYTLNISFINDFDDF